ncbi:putative Polycomb group protein ASXL2 isoform X1 [Etheostoma spectabile]|uniref:putative Polycomb group protein ASXL2 isoform X1 n=1 Tax=Etheostoma spectabile TaxID=54343 RepID=UPI0013AF3516|nr:putative Polycomb group protein ASXL2 isoform X1 [Etheostoma spectabile]
MRERQKKKKGRTWAEAAKTVLEKYPNTPMSHKEILQVIQRERLKEIRSGTSPLACLNAMLHTNSRGEEGIFYKVPGRMGVYTLKKDFSVVAKELSEESSEESSDNLSDSQSTENNSSAVAGEGRTGRWMRRVPSMLQSQPSSPQPRCSSPSVPTGKLISSSQKHSKKALKQALKQQQQRNQRRQGGMPTTSSPRLLLKTIKDMADNITTKTDLCHPVVPRKGPPRSGRLNAGQLKRTKCNIDVETPDSILVNTNLRAIINKHTFSVLPPDCQQRLLKLLPEVDRQACMDGLLKVTSSALNNEFFTSAAQSWKERLSEGEFTPELQLRMRQEIEKEKRVEHWKEAFFENYYGENSGLSFEESKELTEADMNQESARPQSPPHQTGPAAQAPEDPKGSKDSSQTDAATAVKDMKPTKELLKVQPAQREPVSTTEPMKTRRSQYAEDRKLNTTAHSGPAPAVKTVEVEGPTERVPVGTLPEKEHKEEVKEEKTKLPQSPVKKSGPQKDSLELKEDQPVSVVKPAEESKEVNPEPSGPSEPLKRKSLSEIGDELTPEKRPRMSSISSVSSVSSVSPPASSVSSPATPTSTTNQRVPPLKIPVSRILPIPLSPSQLSPRTPLPAPLSSPGRTGARTLADIKAKAQLARAQRAAAAAVSSASKGAVPGPGPGGGSGEQTQPSPSPSPTSPQASTRLPASSSSGQTSTPPPRPLDSFSQLSPNRFQTSYSSKTDDKNKGHSAGTVSAPNSIQMQPTQPSVHALMGQESPSLAISSTKISSCIPANNPLVTQLLQGKEVPLEQILPKPLSKVEVKMSNVPSGSKGKTPHSAEHRSDKEMARQFNTAGHTEVFSEYPRHHRELPDEETQEQILQALIQRKGQQSQPYGGLGPQQPQYKVYQLVHAEEHQDQSRISVGFLGRKRMPRPAMTGHYLLNVSTYGRGPESKRLHQSVIPNTSLSSLKRESTEGEEAAKDKEPANKCFFPASEVKTEQHGCSVTKSDEATSIQHCTNVKTEPGSEDSAVGADNNSTSGTAKEDTSPFSQSQRRHLELCNSNQGNSEPYLNQVDPSYQRQSAFQTQRTLDNQEVMAASCYGGTISMSVPNTLNRSTAGICSPTASSEAGGGVHGSVMSFSVTVTTIPAGHSLGHSNQDDPSPEQSFIEGSNMEDVQSKCYCRLKAMIMCKGCGAFCHDDCIGPSKLCVSCLVVR